MLDEVVVTEHELDDALARTRHRHGELRRAQTRRRGIGGGIAAAFVAAAILIPVLSSGDSQPISTTNPATADVPATRPSPTTPTTPITPANLSPTVTTLAGGSSVDIGTATQSRRTADATVTNSAGGAVAVVSFGCETGGDQISAFGSRFVGSVLHVTVTIDTTDITAPCPAPQALDKTVAIPATLQGQAISVVVDPA